jgi:PAS domain S-box-containing protein
MAGGEMGALIRSMDWSKTPIGPVELWSPTLQTMVRVLLSNRQQVLIWWGPQFCQLYNDAFSLALGDKHPRSMGQPASECWAEAWHIIGPLIEKSFRCSEATLADDLPLEINRHGFAEETHWIIAFSPIPDATMPNQIGGVLGTVNEITEKVAAERRVAEALRASEERFRRYFDLGLVGMAITSPTKGCLEVNDELCHILGYERSELLQKSWTDMTHPDDLTADVTQFNRVLAGEIDGYTLDKRWIRKDARVIDSIMAAKCTRRADGSVDYFVGLVLDTTERKRAETELREAHDQRQMILNSLNDRFFALDSQWRYTYFNRQAEAQLVALGKAPASLMGRVLWEEFPNPPIEEMFRRAMRERIPLTDEHYYAPLGEWVENRIYPTSDGGLAIFQQYITKRKKAEDALRATQAELAHVARVVAMGELTSSIAHEINQPLTVIVANANACQRLLQADVVNVEEIRAAVVDIVAAGQRAAEVITQIRDLLKKRTPAKVPLEMNELIREAITLVSHVLKEHKIALRTDLATDMPCILGDRIQMEQVILNLIMNGVDAMISVDDRPRVLELRSAADGTRNVLVEVEDSGTGLLTTNLEQIFDTFFTTKPSGLGMGLSISRSIITSHGGRLWATANAQYQGATFHFSLPAVV